MATYDVDIDDFTVRNVLEPLLGFPSSVLPPAAFSIVQPLVTYSLAFLSALFHFVSSIASAQGWDSQKILPPLITLLMAYLALVSFYRTTGWMIRTAFWFVKWGGILAALAAGQELLDLLGERGERLAAVLDDLPEEEVLALDGGGALVEGVDLRVAEHLLHRLESRAEEILAQFLGTNTSEGCVKVDASNRDSISMVV